MINPTLVAEVSHIWGVLDTPQTDWAEYGARLETVGKLADNQAVQGFGRLAVMLDMEIQTAPTIEDLITARQDLLREIWHWLLWAALPGDPMDDLKEGFIRLSEHRDFFAKAQDVGRDWDRLESLDLALANIEQGIQRLEARI